MKGSCPECSRSYEISDEFLAMGGKAKCPHCMLDLSFTPAAPEGREEAAAEEQPRSRRNPRRAPTRIAPDLRPAAPVDGPEEVDAFCDTCSKRFKIDAEYLRMGGAAACPHCAQRLRIDPATDPRRAAQAQANDELSTDRHASEEQDEPAAEETVEASYGEAGGFGLGDLGLELEAGGEQAGAAPVSVEDQREPSAEETALETEDTALPTEVMSSPFVAAREVAEASLPAEAPPEEPPAEAAAAPAPEAVEISDGGFDLPSMEPHLPDRTLADRTVAERGQAEEPGGPGFDAAMDALSLPLEAVGDQSPAPREPSSPETSDETMEVDALAAQAAKPAGDDSGVFSGLASNDDWAEAAQRWAKSGFKAEEMPGFIRASGGASAPEAASPPTVAAQPPAAAPRVDSPPTVAVVPPAAGPGRTLPHGQAALAEARPDTVEVSDADILTLADSEVEEVAAEPAEGSWAARAAGELKAQKPAEKPVVPSRPGLQLAWLGRLANPAMLAGVLGLVVLAVVTFLWLFLGRTEDVSALAFPIEGLKNPVVQAADPSPYRTRDEALRHYGLGNRLAFTGDAEGAIAEYQAAQRIDPGFPHPHRALGAMFAALGKTELAVQSYESYLRLSPRGPDADQVRQIVEKTKGK